MRLSILWLCLYCSLAQNDENRKMEGYFPWLFGPQIQSGPTKECFNHPGSSTENVIEIQKDLKNIVKSKKCLNSLTSGDKEKIDMKYSSEIDVKHPFNAYHVLKEAFAVSKKVIKMLDNKFDCSWRFNVNEQDLQSVRNGLLNIQIYSRNRVIELIKGNVHYLV